MKMKKVAMLLILIFMLLTLSSCWDMTELNKIGIIGALGIDYEDGQYKLTYEIDRPRRAGKSASGEAEKEPYTYIESEGESLFDALRNASSIFGRKLYSPDIRVYLFSEKAARKGILDFFEFLERYPETRIHVAALIAKDASISEILSVKGNIEDTTSEYISALLDETRFNVRGLYITVRKYLFRRPQSGREGTLGVIERITKKPVTSADQKSEKANTYILKLEGAGVFLDDYLKGFLNGNETRYLNYINGDVRDDAITVKGPGDYGITSVNVVNSKSKKEVEINGNDVSLYLKIDLKAMQLVEHTDALDVYDPKTIKEIENSVSAKVKAEVENTVKKVQSEFHSDIFGFGESLYFKNPGEWQNVKENWSKLFSKGKVTVEVKTQITRHGAIDTPLKRIEE